MHEGDEMNINMGITKRIQFISNENKDDKLMDMNYELSKLHAIDEFLEENQN